MDIKYLNIAIDILADTNLLDLKNDDWSPEAKEILLSTLKSDINNIRSKNK